MRTARALLALSLLLLATSAGCPKKEEPAGPVADTTSPPDSPVAYKVLEDKIDNNYVEYHVLITDGTKHDDVENLLKYLYRYLWTRRDEPAGLTVGVYTQEAAFKTPPRTPIASVLRKSGDAGPTFENKVPLEFWQEVEFAVHPRRDSENEEAYKKRRESEEKAALKPKIERDDPKRTVTLTIPYAEPNDKGVVDWVPTLSFNQAMNAFTDNALELFENVGDLRHLTFVGVHKDKEVVRIDIDKADYAALKLNELAERIGQHHGRTFLELATNRTNDDKAAKDTAARISKEYKAMLAQLKGKAKVDAALK